MPARAASHSTASGKPRCSTSRTKVMTSPRAWQPKQYHTPSLALTENDGVFSLWKGQRPFQRCPSRRSWMYWLITPTMSDAALTPATSSSRMPIRARLPAVARRPGRQRRRARARAARRLTVNPEDPRTAAFPDGPRRARTRCRRRREAGGRGRHGRNDGGWPAPALTPHPVASSVEELIDGATGRRPFRTSDAKSGSSFERVEIDGERYVLKVMHVDDDWLARSIGDVTCRPVRVWAAGLLDAFPPRSTTRWSAPPPAWAGMAGERRCSCGTSATGSCPPATGRCPLDQHANFLDHLAELSARFWGWTDTVGLTPPTLRGRSSATPCSTSNAGAAGPTRFPGSPPPAGGPSPNGHPTTSTTWSTELRRAAVGHQPRPSPPRPRRSSTATGRWATSAATPTAAPS